MAFVCLFAEDDGEVVFLVNDAVVLLLVVGDDETGFAAEEGLEVADDALFGRLVQCGGRLVHQQEARVAEQCPSHRYALQLAAR